MKKLMTALLGLSLAIGCVTPSFADDNKPKKAKKKKPKKQRKGA